MPKDKRDSGGRMGSARTASLSASDVNGVVRRIGFVVMTAYQTMMSRLIADGSSELAEALGDALKPAADYLVHFDIDDRDTDAGGSPDGDA